MGVPVGRRIWGSAAAMTSALRHNQQRTTTKRNETRTIALRYASPVGRRSTPGGVRFDLAA